MKQLIIARKDLNMSAGKLAAQVSHASMAFLTNAMRAHSLRILECERGRSFQFNRFTHTKEPMLYRRNDLTDWAREAFERGEDYFFFRPVDSKNPYGQLELCEPTHHIEATIPIDMQTWDEWICGNFTKVVCEAKNRYQLEKVKDVAATLGLEENKDYFLIYDNCFTELTPEEDGRTLTCIGFRPLPDDITHTLSKKYQLYK